MNSKEKRHPIAEVKKILDYYRITNLDRAKRIIALLHKFEEIEKSYCALCSFQTRSYVYVSPSFERMTDYPMNKVAVNGYEFFMSITAKESIPYISQRQAQYIKEINSHHFNFLKPNPVEFDASIVYHGGEIVPVSQISVMLDYEPGGNIKTFFAVWFESANLSKAVLSKKKALLWEMLKDFHRLIFSPGPVTKQNALRRDLLITLKTPQTNIPKLSPRERELLIFLGKGKSLKEAASKMQIGYTTAETHRKNLFKKFETKSTADLIKKASKVFWLE